MHWTKVLPHEVVRNSQVLTLFCFHFQVSDFFDRTEGLFREMQWQKKLRGIKTDLENNFCNPETASLKVKLLKSFCRMSVSANEGFLFAFGNTSWLGNRSLRKQPTFRDATHHWFPGKIGTLISNDATAMRTSLKKWICVLSFFIAIIPTHLLCQM